ncbi:MULTISPECIES: GBS Bsp-like repeat-containing protein [Clostridia]|uniref:GBS Bsp-like repeat-containing protein n=1 Tax=Faecalicatena fissicatena TaxID=290055 RepID=A0ABS2EB81_9FIRM|nr:MULTISPECIES: GBS Bsp-like repeat-containing protein [Clostridia]MBM6738885.1 GBS Bsp-like repeat-containing protein [Faecalicatena fissicatena]HIX99548.1 GBS Bsp-like repeat-containing protein [Candidatus Dorea intestinigallinarum]
MRNLSVFVKAFFRILFTILAVLLAVLATVITCSLRWMFDTWSNLTMDELIYHLTSPLDGTNDAMIREYIDTCIVPAVIVLLFLLVLFAAFRKKKRYYIVMAGAIVLSVSVGALSVRGAWQDLDVGNYVADRGTYSTFIDDNYVSPSDVELTFPQEKRNLIYIFLESMETTYADTQSGGAFDRNVIPELTQIAQENEDFSGETADLNGGYSMPGTTWTIGAMFAQTSGLPLSVSIDGNSMDTQTSFFAGAVTLGDILESQGYSQTLLIGSDAAFGGRELYFTEHGNYEMMDYKYAVQNGLIPEDYHVWWGYEDEKLFEFARQKVTELAAQPEPFNLTMLTVDTHFEDGYVCERCPQLYGDDQYSNVMRCSSRQVSAFVQWLQQQDFYENTTIILCGDHPTMDSDYCEDIDSGYTRKTYTAYINAAAQKETETRRDFTTFDQFPTTLAALGVQIEGNRLGLGTNLFSSEPTLTERFGRETEERELKKNSQLIEKLADIDYDSESLKVREGRVPTGTVYADPYLRDIGGIPVTVTDLANLPDEVQSVQIAVWTNEDQSDLQWIQLGAREDGSFGANINVANYGFKLGVYYIDAYIVDSTGTPYMIGQATGYVD